MFKDKINNVLVVDCENYIYCCYCFIFIDQQLFDFEMKYIFEGNWVFFVYESQIVELGDYYILMLGWQLVIIICDKKNELYVLINSCVYCGVMLC